MNDLGRTVSGFCDQHFGGLKKACSAAGLKYTTLHAQISHEREIPFSTIERLCSTAGVSLDMFRGDRAAIGVAPVNTSDVLHRRAAAAYTQALRDVRDDMRRFGTDILVDDVLNWLHRHGGRLTDFDTLRERVDLFEAARPNDRIMQASRIGRGSLAARYFNISDTSEYLAKVGQLDRSIVDTALASHLKVQETQRYQIEDVSITGQIDGREIHEKYRRIMAPVETLDGKKLTLVFAKILESAYAEDVPSLF
jgi:hypothetical protein